MTRSTDGRPWFLNLQSVLTFLCGLSLVLALAGVANSESAPYSAYASVLFGSYFALGAAWSAIKERSLDVNLLMVLAAIGAIVVGHSEDAAALLFLFSLSSTLESLAMAKTRSAIEGLIRLRPDTALRVVDGNDTETPTSELKVGDIVRVLPFQQIPADGSMLQGAAQIDESAMTGESRPVEKVEGDSLLAGTQNLDSMVLMTVSVEVGDSTLDKIVGLVEDAQENKASGERISQWFGQRYTVFVVLAFLVSFGVRMVTGAEIGSALYNALILLVALSPCALVISTPASTLSALAFAARRGILVRGGMYIEEAGRIDIAALDKTGTLTEGKPKLMEVCIGMGWSDEPDSAHCSVPAIARKGGVACAEECRNCTCITCWRHGEPLRDDSAEALRLAAAAEVFSTHPIAEAIVASAREHAVEIPSALQHTAMSGLGVTADIDGDLVKIGQSRFFTEAGESLPGGFREHVADIQARGMTAVLMRYQDKWAAFGMSDSPRANAPQLIQELRDAGVGRIVMLTGDNAETARAIAEQLGVDEAHAGLMPSDKAAMLDKWIAEGKRVMMVGDGVNDAPALARANLGIAMGGLGSDIALNAADVVLVQDRIERIPLLMRLGRMTNRVIRANLLFAAGMILTLTLLSMVWHYVPFLAQFSKDMPLPLAVIGHEGSTVIVILNGLRLLRGPGEK